MQNRSQQKTKTRQRRGSMRHTRRRNNIQSEPKVHTTKEHRRGSLRNRGIDKEDTQKKKNRNRKRDPSETKTIRIETKEDTNTEQRSGRT